MIDVIYLFLFFLKIILLQFHSRDLRTFSFNNNNNKVNENKLYINNM